MFESNEYKRIIDSIFGAKTMLGIQYNPENHGNMLISDTAYDDFMKERHELLSFLVYLYHLNLLEVKTTKSSGVTHILLDPSLSDYIFVRDGGEGRPDIFVPKEFKALANAEYHFLKVFNDALLLGGSSIHDKVNSTFYIAMASAKHISARLKESGNAGLGFYDEDCEPTLIQTESVQNEDYTCFLEKTDFQPGTEKNSLSGRGIKRSNDLPYRFSGDLANDIKNLNLNSSTPEEMADVCGLTAALLSVTFDDALSHLISVLPNANRYQTMLNQIKG
ncbi:MAG: hypothetical protein QM500_12290 [Methylococcales bacterium]